MARVDRIRQRTIPQLTAMGVDHMLHLLPTMTLFDRPRLEIYGDVDRKAIRRIFRDGQFYQVKVSSFGKAQAYVTCRHLKFLPAKGEKRASSEGTGL